jgi:cytidine diphosphoramidate kinase
MVNVFWITGLSAAGKTTLGGILTEYLRNEGRSVVMFDGDEMREALGLTSSDYRREARLTIAYKYARLARMIAAQGVTVVVSTVSLYKEIHEWNRSHQPGYFEVYLKVPIEELRRRDPKGMYRRFDAGELQNVSGLDISIDEPINPNLVIEYKSGMTLERELDEILAAYRRHGLDIIF